MTSSYALRLVCLSLAVAMCAPAITRRAERWSAQAAARLMLILRLAPGASAIFVVFAICIPSYLRLEPDAMDEEIGVACLILAAMGVASWGFSMLRTARALVRSRRYMENWKHRGVETTIGGTRVWIVDGAGRTLALAGVFRPRLIVSREVVEALPADQLAAALRHEQAHASAWDNFKRLLMLLAPAIGFSSQVERAWARFTEWSADDRAAEGDADRSLALAGALVSVARMGSSPVPPLATALMANAGDLEIRVDRLLRERDEVRPVPASLVAGSLITAISMLTLALYPATWPVAYRILERLVD